MSSNLQQAADTLMAAIRAHPDDARHHLQLGNLLAGVGDWAAAEVCYANCCHLQPKSANLQYNWGVSLQELSRIPEAIEAFERALTINPGYAAAFFALGLAYKRLEAFDAALVAFDCAIGLDGKDPKPRLERGRTLLQMGRHAECLAEIDAQPDAFRADPEVQNLRGIALKHLGRAQEALAAYDLAIRARPDYLDAIYNRANLRLLARQFSLALEDFDRAHALKPDLDWLPGLRLYTAMHVFDWREVDARLAALLDDVSQGRRGVQPLVLECLVDDPAAHQQAARIWHQSTQAPRVAWEPAVAPAQDGRIRVAYVSRDFKPHPVAYLMAEVFELHDRERFEVIGINYGAARDDEVQARLRAGFDRFLDVAHLQDKQIAELCRQLGVDIAVDLTGFTEGARGGIFAWRAAPVQMLYIGYLGTSGSPLYDYLIADPVTVPPETRPFHDERILYLPSYQANDRRRPRPPTTKGRAALGLPETGFVYCCFNNPCKITPAVFETWMTILRQVPGSVLWVLEEDPRAAENLRAHAARLGVAGERIVLAGRADRDAYLASLRAADLFLDTLPYNAGATASDALWMGLPVLTRLGQSFCARVAASLLTAVGLPELIARDADDYVRRAVDLATRPGLLDGLRQRLRDGARDSALFDAPGFVRTLEAGYEAVHRARLSGAAPDDVRVG
ncbi:hypothetical protein CDN99_17600 [Roseateles aquatilis]|uniref:protein O-GlcNAc transferase n=1 Tax=Roseateles aquatilis TaxID=431061 RepID=A0A246J5A4_9BURK|nr:tetratricopeptide repeat protein [Roseateles aquatilis]OWQ87706.1 hypothetical protein CDN99_17600 [Roseateles aquatilis]